LGITRSYSLSFEKMLQPVIEGLRFSLLDRTDVFFTTSFGYQSELLFFLMREANINADCVFIKSPLTVGGVQEQKDFLLAKYSVRDFIEIDRSEWVRSVLDGRDFLDLDEKTRKLVCRSLKRAPLIDYIETKAMKAWVTGIRRDQTPNRESSHFIDATDMGVIKISPMFNWTSLQVSEIVEFLGLKTNNEYVDFCKINTERECGLHT
jgi:phosphoadenosine phosphosulfate reductase